MPFPSAPRAGSGGLRRGGGDPGPRPRILVLTGPTASGKTALALTLAEALGAEVVSADSMQVYRFLDVGTAKPTPEERGRVPHHLIDVADPDETYSAGRFRAEAGAAISGILARGRVPLVCGGTALYLKALLEGLAPSPARDPGVRRELEAAWEAGGRAALRDELRRADAELAARLHPNDRARILRGLEVWRAAGRRLSDLQREHGFAERPYEALRLGVAVERGELHRRIDRRVLAMLEAGWAGEVRGVLARGYPPGCPGLQGIGYRELCACLARGGDPAEAAPAIQRATRQLAKRQLTWFRRMGLSWVGPGDAAAALEAAKNFLQRPPPPL